MGENDIPGGGAFEYGLRQSVMYVVGGGTNDVQRGRSPVASVCRASQLTERTATMPDNTLPLSGVRVDDFTDGTAGFAGRFLADLGADVILVEPPGGAAHAGRSPNMTGTGCGSRLRTPTSAASSSTSAALRGARRCSS